MSRNYLISLYDIIIFDKNMSWKALGEYVKLTQQSTKPQQACAPLSKKRYMKVDFFSIQNNEHTSL